MSSSLIVHGTNLHNSDKILFPFEFCRNAALLRIFCLLKLVAHRQPKLAVREAGLSERWFVKGAQLTRMEAIAFGAQQVDGANTDLQMLGDRPFIEAVRLAGQLNLAVQRLVRDAEQRTVRHTEAVTLRGDGGALHINCYRAAQVKAQR